ncbi:MAG TPA: hypothetical protein PKH10_11715, partial [bacterium]|nr:hypothetical protein [bacterium]
MKSLNVALFAGWSAVLLLSGCSGDVYKIDRDAVRADKDSAVTGGDTDEALADDLQNDQEGEDADGPGNDAPLKETDSPGDPDEDGYYPDDAYPDDEESDGYLPDDMNTDDGEPDGAYPDEADPDETTPDGDLPDDAQPDDATPDSDNETPDEDLPQICTPLEIVDCPYSGDPDKIDVVPCKVGTKQCNLNGTEWSDCSGVVLPAATDPCTDSVITTVTARSTTATMTAPPVAPVC